MRLTYQARIYGGSLITQNLTPIGNSLVTETSLIAAGLLSIDVYTSTIGYSSTFEGESFTGVGQRKGDMKYEYGSYNLNVILALNESDTYANLKKILRQRHKYVRILTNPYSSLADNLINATYARAVTMPSYDESPQNAAWYMNFTLQFKDPLDVNT